MDMHKRPHHYNDFPGVKPRLSLSVVLKI